MLKCQCVGTAHWPYGRFLEIPEAVVFRSALIILLMLAAVFSVSSCSKSADLVVAEVDGRKITASQLRSKMAIEASKFDHAELTVPANLKAFRKQTLEVLIEESVLLAEALKKNIEVKDSEIDEEFYRMTGIADAAERGKALRGRGIDPDILKESHRRRLAIEALIQKEIFDNVPISDEEIEKYYTLNKQKFIQPVQYEAKQIVVNTRKLAEEISAKLKNGENFSELAKKYSLSPDAKRGGELGYFDANSYPKAFTDICAKLDIGKISGVVVTDYGYQIFKLLDKKPAKQLKVDEVRQKIKRTLFEERNKELLSEWFEDLRSRSKIFIDENALSEVMPDEKK